MSTSERAASTGVASALGGFSMSGWSLGRVLKLAWIPIVTALATVPAAEVAYRVAGTRVAATMEGFYEQFGDKGYIHRANASAFMNWFSGDFHVYTDAMGFRVAKPGATANPKPDVLVLGDSEPFGQGVEYEDSVIGVFETSASAAGLSVGNVSAGGHFLRNQTEWCEDLVKKHGLAPKVLMVCFTPRLLGNPDAYSDAYVHEGALFGGKPGRKELVRKWLSGNSTVYLTVRDAVRRFEGEKQTGNEILGLYVTGAEQERRLEIMRRELSELEAVFGASKPAMVLVYFPLSVEDQIDALGRAAGRLDVSGSAAREGVRRLAEVMGAGFVDLTPSLNEARAAGEALTLDGDAHYSVKVNHRAGSRLWEGASWAELSGSGLKRY